MGKTERIQYQEVALAITGVWQGSCRSKLYEELGWESLSERRWCRRILQIHKIVSDKMPSYLKNKLPRLRRPLYRQSTSNTFQELKCKSLPTQLLLGIMLLLILMIFHLLVFLKTICIFGIHDPLRLRYLFQLRLGFSFSSLRYHKNVTSSLIPILTNVFVIRVLKIRITSYFCVLFSATRRATLAINVISILQEYDLTHLGNQSHLYLYGHRTLFNVSLLPYPIHPTMSQSHLSFITIILHSFVSMCM